MREQMRGENICGEDMEMKHTFDKWELIEEVKKESEIGKLVVQVHLNYLRWFKRRLEG